MLCYIVWSDCGYTSGAVCRMADETMRSFSSRETDISHGEVFSLLFCLLEEEPILRGAIHFVVWMPLESFRV